VGLGPRFRRALAFALDAHADQRRKGTETPYAGHVLGVAAVVIDAGGTEDEAIAALLHDAAEDAGGRRMLARIEREFGAAVAALVESLSDTLETPKPPWRERKEAYVEHIGESSDSAVLVSLADKLYNARAILLDYRDVGEKLWERFNADREDVLWYYESLAEAFHARRPGVLADELAATVAELRRNVESRRAGGAAGR
jgi:(p)ppGpp synthase/HD superfamily hydrolase